MPTMIARIKTSKAELTANEILAMRLRAKDSKRKCSSGLYWGVTRWTVYIQDNTDDFNPFFASSAEA
jgi:hypothetical protein